MTIVEAAGIMDLKIVPCSIEHLEKLIESAEQIQFNPGRTVVSALMHILGSYEGTPVEQNIRFTRIWAISSSGSIQIIAGHTSAILPT
jgi:hypothetical protein